MRLRSLCSLFVFLLASYCLAQSAASLRIALPLGRTAYQTNERIELAVTRSAPRALAAGALVLTLAGIPGVDDGTAPGAVGAMGSRLSFTFTEPAVPLAGNDACATEYLYLNGWLLRPGRYAIEAACDGASAKTEIAVFSHLRRSTFKTYAWGSSAHDAEIETMGEDSLGFNMLYLNGLGDDTIRAGVDWMQTCYQGGGSQMDLRGECDWSDPNVIRGGAARLSRGALIQRRQPNVLGLHFYDELMLTNAKDPLTGEKTPHSVPAQHQAYLAATGSDVAPYSKIDPNKPEDAAQWDAWARWKLSLLDANHKLCRWAVNDVEPDYLAVNQTQCWWMYFANGNYFNVARSLPVINGHCWYDFGPPDYFSPTQFLEIGRARELDKPNWFLPTWFTFAPTTRLEHYLSFMTNIQGVAIPPDTTVQRPYSPNPGGFDVTEAVVETNKTMARLGTIFNTMPVTRPPVAMLYSLSSNIDRELHDMAFTGNNDKQYYAMMFLYLSGKMIQNPFFTVLDEDVVDGTLAAQHKAVVIGGVDYLSPEVVAGLEAFAKQGGLVLVSADCGVKIAGATRLQHTALHPEQDKILKLWQDKKYGDITDMMKIADLFKVTEPLAAEIEQQLNAHGIAPVFRSDNRGIAAYRQAQGDIEYLFAANATPDSELGPRNALRAATATLTIPDDGRPVYDALLARRAGEFSKKAGNTLAASLRFGPGQMRVFARTARPIGGVRALTPTVLRDYTRDTAPLRVQVGATLVDTHGGVLAGAAPLRIKLIDPLGAVRYDLYRATTDGTWHDELPLAANDPPGQWAVSTSELLSGATATATFTLAPAPQCGALAGTAQRALSFGNDREHIYRFFRTHRTLTIVKGTQPFEAEAAQRLAAILAPWDVQCKIVDAAEVEKTPELSEAQAKTWVGLDYAPSGAIKAGANPPQVAGYSLREPAILLGSPDDNALINFLNRYSFLPYAPQRDAMPGRGRGYLAWQRDGIAREQESITLIAYDAAGMNEAVGSLYEAATGLDPLTPWKMPARNSIGAATAATPVPPQAPIAWQLTLPDRAVAVKPLGAGRVVVLGYDGTLAAINAKGKTEWQQEVDTGHAWNHRLDVSATGNLIAVAGRNGLLAFNGQGKKLFDIARPGPKGVGHPVPRVTFVAVSPDGTRIADGGPDGKLTVSDSKGAPLWGNAGWTPASKFYFEDALFSDDSAELVALTDTQATAFAVADGKSLGSCPGADCRYAPARLGHNLLLADGKTLTLFSPADGKALSTVPLPGGAATLAATDGAALLSTETDSAVQQLQAAAGKLPAPTPWTPGVTHRLVKQIAAGPAAVAVAYWGGTVHLLQHDGKLLSARVFEQDITRMAWLNDLLVVALADGRLIALKAQ